MSSDFGAIKPSPTNNANYTETSFTFPTKIHLQDDIIIFTETRVELKDNEQAIQEKEEVDTK